MRSIFGVDPGLHVGLLHFRLDTRFVEMLELGPLEAADWLHARVRGGDFIAVERYTQTAGSAKRTRQNDAIEVIGMCRWIAHRNLAVILEQGASEAKKVAPPDILKALGWWSAGDPDHIRRAAAQAAHAYAQADPVSFEELTRPGTVV